jgi:hypothetical protein
VNRAPASRHPLGRLAASKQVLHIRIRTEQAYIEREPAGGARGMPMPTYRSARGRASASAASFAHAPLHRAAVKFRFEQDRTPVRRGPHRCAKGGLLFGEALRSGFWCLLWLCFSRFSRGARFSIGRVAIV